VSGTNYEKGQKGKGKQNLSACEKRLIWKQNKFILRVF
jgi:hypothetical protein